MQRPWIYLANPMLTATEGSFSNALLVTNYHYAALNNAQSDPFINPIFNSYLPFHAAYTKAYDQWKAQEQKQTGNTLSLKQLLDGLTRKVNKWEAGIILVFDKDTPEYQGLLGSGHAPFLNGSQTSRISAVRGLFTNLSDYPVLAATRNDVESYYYQLENALNTKDVSKQNTTRLSEAVEAARGALCTQQYANLGMLIHHFAATPELIGKFFDLEIIRSSSQTVFTQTLDVNQVYTIAKRTLDPTDKLRITTGTGGGSRFYFAFGKDEAEGSVYVDVQANSETTINASQLGDVVNNHYLTVHNTDLLQGSSFKLELL